MATPMTLEGCAELRAEMEAGQLRDEVLARAALTVEAWTAAQTEWLDRMGAEMERGRFELTNRYSQAFLERQRALQALTAKPIEAPVEAAPMTLPMPPTAASPPVTAELPSFLLPVSPSLPDPVAAPAPMPAPGKTRPPSALSGTSMGFVAPKVDALPFARSPVAAPPAVPRGALPEGASAAPPRPVVNRAPAALSGTSTGFVAPKGAPLPFAKAPAPPVEVDETQPPAPGIRMMLDGIPGTPFVSRPSPAGPQPALDGTTMGAISPFAAAVLPFSPSAAPAASPQATSTPLPASPPAPPAPRAVERDSMDVTTMGAPSPFARVMPFAGAPAPTAPIPPLLAAPLPKPSAPPRPSPPPKPAPPPPRAAPSAAQVAAVAPKAASSAGPLLIGGYTLEQHVSLCAEMTFNPARVAETLARYRITAEGKAELDRLWKERFSADPALESRWREAHGMYLTFLGARRP